MNEEATKMCRTCLTDNVNMFNLFTCSDPEDISLAVMLMSCASVKVNSKETLPDVMCAPCIKTLTRSYNFKKQCERSDKLLRTMNSSNNENCEFEVLESVGMDVNTKKNVQKIEQDIASVESEEEISLESKNSKLGNVNVIKSEDKNQRSEVESVYNDELISKIRNQKNVHKFTCDLCQKSFSKHGNLKHHMTTHNDGNECLHCGIKCESYEDLILHNRENHRLFKCQYCDKSFSTGNALNGHMRCHKNIRDVLLCKENVGDSAEYICVIGANESKEQAKETTVNGKQVDMEQVIQVEGFSCEECDYSFINKEDLYDHMKIHEPNHECSVCTLKFSSYSDLIVHNNTVHNTFNCKICTKSFATPHAVSGHMRYHSNITGSCRYYKCTEDNCTKMFSSVEYLKRHKLAHQNSKRVFLCNLCGKTYNLNNSFYYHLKMHSNERPHVCSYCGNKYKLKCHLKTHMWRHTGIRPHQCKRCGKQFSRPRVLRKHIETNCGSKKRKIQNADLSREIIIKNEILCSDSFESEIKLVEEDEQLEEDEEEEEELEETVYIQEDNYAEESQ